MTSSDTPIFSFMKRYGFINYTSTKAEKGLQTSDFRLQTSDFRLQTSDFRLQTSVLFSAVSFQLIFLEIKSHFSADFRFHSTRNLCFSPFSAFVTPDIIQQPKKINTYASLVCKSPRDQSYYGNHNHECSHIKSSPA